MKTIITSDTSSSIDLPEILRFKSLLWNLSTRDVLVRYKQTVFGVIWAVARPLINIVIFGFFSQFIERASNIPDRFVAVSAGVIIWGLISSAITEISNSLLTNSNILTKVYFPKIIIPVTDIPRTISGKITEIAVREIRSFLDQPSSVEEVRVVLFGEESLRTFEHALRQ